MTSEEYFKTYGQDPFARIEDKTANATRGVATEMTSGILNNVGGFAKGVAQSATRSLQNIGMGVGRAVGLPTEGFGFDESTFQADTRAERVGQFTGDILQHVLAAKATGGLGTAGFIAGQAGVGGARTGTARGAVESGVAAAVVPPLMRGVGKLVSGVLTKWSAGLTNLPTNKGVQAIQTIFQNPQKAEQAFTELKKEGGTKILQKNAKTIVNGVSTIKREARAEFGRTLEGLGKIDLPREQLQTTLEATLREVGITMQKGKIVAGQSEIISPAIRRKLESLLTSLNKAPMASGKDARNFINVIEKAKFSVSAKTDADRLAYNAVLNKLKESTLGVVDTATGGKIGAMNTAFSEQMQLTEAMESIFGKIQYRSAKELLKTANKLDQLFTQKPASVDVINRFLTRLGVDPSDLMVSESVRQIGAAPAVGGGTTPGLIGRAVDTATRPMDVARLAQRTGIATETLRPIFDRLDNVGQATLIRLLSGQEQ